METDPLQQLRDIHLPVEPSWWPPAIGWWLIAVALIILIYWATDKFVTAWRRRAPIRAARAIYVELYRDYERGDLDIVAYCHGCNELLKRLLVHGLAQTNVAAKFDTTWLSELDRRSDSTLFTQGGGAALGVERFKPSPSIDADGLNHAMQHFLKSVSP